MTALASLRRSAAAAWTPDGGQGHTATAPLLGWRGLALAAAFALVLCWPMLVMGAPLVYFDSFTYYDLGAKIVGRLSAALAHGAIDGSASGGGSSHDGPAAGAKIRSIPYTLYLWATAWLTGGFAATAWLQATVSLWMTLGLVPDRLPDPRRLAIGLCAVGLLTTLPWFVSYAMPDILVVPMVLFYIFALRRLDGFTRGQTVAAVLVAIAAISAHFGHLPLALLLATVVLAWRAWGRRVTPTIVALCLAPVAVPAGFNLLFAEASTGEASVAPSRFPILLARSLEDGPARWYLERACPTTEYTMCELFPDGVPDNVADFLWAKDGYGRATDAQVKAIRRQEAPLLWAAFRAYPLQQTSALFGNASRQIVSVGTGELLPMPPYPAGATLADLRPSSKEARRSVTLGLFDRITPIATLLALLWLSWEAARGRAERLVGEAFALVVLALLGNAVIYGGLSAPVDRYQSRLVWLIPALLVLRFGWPRPCVGERPTHAPGSAP